MGSLVFAILSAMLIIGVSPKAINFCTVLQSKIFRMNIIANSIPNSLITFRGHIKNYILRSKI